MVQIISLPQIEQTGKEQKLELSPVIDVTDWMTVRKIGKYLGISEALVYNAISKGQLSGGVKQASSEGGPKVWFFPKESVDAYNKEFRSWEFSTAPSNEPEGTASSSIVVESIDQDRETSSTPDAAPPYVQIASPTTISSQEQRLPHCVHCARPFSSPDEYVVIQLTDGSGYPHWGPACKDQHCDPAFALARLQDYAVLDADHMLLIEDLKNIHAEIHLLINRVNSTISRYDRANCESSKA